MIHNPSLREIPVHEPAEVIPSKQEMSLLHWLESTHRLIARDGQESSIDYLNDEEEISELMAVDDSVYDDDDDDLDEDLLED